MQTQKLFLGIDIGSSAVKSILLDIDNGIVASDSIGVKQYSEFPGWSEANTDEWWSGIKKSIPNLLKSVDTTANSVKGIAVTGMVPALVAVGSNRRPVRRALLQNDARASVEIEEIRKKLSGVDLLATTGSVISQQWIAPSISWLAKHEPEKLINTKFIMGSYDWVAYFLGADLHVEQNWAIESGLFKLDGTLFAEVINSVNVQWPEIPNIRKSSESVGSVSEFGESETGLIAGTPIYVGGADHVLSAYGAGLFEQGDGLVKLGGAGDVLVVSNKKIVDERLYLDAHPIPNKWLPNGCMATSGSILRWEQNLFNNISLEELDGEAEEVAPGNLLMLPYFLGEKTPLHDPNLRGAILGLHLGTKRGDIHRAILESIAYGFRHHLQIFTELGLAVKKPKVTNGGSKSRLWRKILADALNLEITSIFNHPGASYGAAVCAGVGSGLIDDWTYVAKYLEIGESVEPNSENVRIYDERFAEYLAVTKNLKDTLHNLARSQNE